MQKNLICTLLLVCVCSLSVVAQKNKRRTIDVGGFLGANTVVGDMTTTNYPESFRPSLGGLIRIVPNDRIAYRAMLGYESLYGFGETEMDNVVGSKLYGFSKRMVSLSGLYEVNWNNYRVRKKKMKFSPFLGIGLEANFFFENGHGFVYEDGISSEGFIENPMYTGDDSQPSFVDQEVSEFTISVPIVFGVKYNLGGWWSMSAEVYAKKFFTDKIDNLDDPYRYFDNTEQFLGTSSSHNNDWILGGRICIYYQIYHGCRACPDFN